MADDTHNTSDLSDPVTAGSPKEDAETKATREELKQTAISDDKTKTASAGQDDDAALARTKTPELDLPGANRDSLKEQVSSPKKKRGHDEVDEQRDVEGADPASSATISERDKKRQRDGQATEEDKTADQTGTTVAADKATDTTAQAAGAASPKKADTASTTTSSSAFASSGLSKLTGTTSPFGALGGSAKPSVFGGASSAAGSASPFGSLGGAAPAAKPAAPSLSFGNKPGASSPFATLNGPSTSTFGSAFPSGFGSTLPGGAKLSSFAKPGDVFKSDKPAKPFGAPESDAEEGDDDDEGSDVNEQSGAEEVESEEKEKEEPKAVVDDKKKPKLQKVSVDDGEAGEATIFSARTRLYHLEKETGWKERGAGIIKVNVPEASVEFDEAGVAIPASFDASVLDEEDDEESGGERKSKVVRLIMRQDSTHRVILNTVVVPATDFQKRTALKYTTVLFPAFEGEDAKPVSMQMKLSEANAENFIQLMVGIQKELRGE